MVPRALLTVSGPPESPWHESLPDEPAASWSAVRFSCAYFCCAVACEMSGTLTARSSSGVDEPPDESVPQPETLAVSPASVAPAAASSAFASAIACTLLLSESGDDRCSSVTSWPCSGDEKPGFF